MSYDEWLPAATPKTRDSILSAGLSRVINSRNRAPCGEVMYRFPRRGDSLYPRFPDSTVDEEISLVGSLVFTMPNIKELRNGFTPLCARVTTPDFSASTWAEHNATLKIQI